MPADPRQRAGFTLVEMLVANVLMALLVILIAGAWKAFGPLCVEVIARGRVANEANIAAAALYREATAARPGLSLAKVETLDEASVRFDYSTDGSIPASGIFPYAATYALSPASQAATSAEMLLVRSDDAGSVTIARHLESAVARNVAVADATGRPSQVEITFSFAYRGARSQYTFAVQHQ